MSDQALLTGLYITDLTIAKDKSVNKINIYFKLLEFYL